MGHGDRPGRHCLSAQACFGHPRCTAVEEYHPFTVATRQHPTHCGTDNTFANRRIGTTTEAGYVTEVSGTIVVTSSGQSPLSLHCTGSQGCEVQIPH